MGGSSFCPCLQIMASPAYYVGRRGPVQHEPVFESNFGGSSYLSHAKVGRRHPRKKYHFKFQLMPPNENTSLTVTHKDDEPVMYLRKGGGASWVCLKEGEWNDLLGVTERIARKLKECRLVLRGKAPSSAEGDKMTALVTPSPASLRYEQRQMKRLRMEREAALAPEESEDDDVPIGDESDEEKNPPPVRRS